MQPHDGPQPWPWLAPSARAAVMFPETSSREPLHQLGVKPIVSDRWNFKNIKVLIFAYRKPHSLLCGMVTCRVDVFGGQLA